MIGTCPFCKELVNISKPNRDDGKRRCLYHYTGPIYDLAKCAGIGQACVEDSHLTAKAKVRRAP